MYTEGVRAVAGAQLVVLEAPAHASRGGGADDPPVGRVAVVGRLSLVGIFEGCWAAARCLGV